MIRRILKIVFLPIRMLNFLIYGKEEFVALAWFSPKEFKKAPDLIPDYQKFESYEMWQENAEGLLRDYEEKGLLTVKLEVEVDDLQKWLLKNKFENSQANREEYIRRLLRQELENGLKISNKTLINHAK